MTPPRLEDLSLPPVPARDPRGHKGTFGTVGVVGGCARGDRRMIGAPALVARAALRAGAGLVKIGAPAPILDAAITICPSATGMAIEVDRHGDLDPASAAEAVRGLAASCDVLAIGPGLGFGAGAYAGALAAVLVAMRQARAAVVLDADALNAIAAAGAAAARGVFEEAGASGTAACTVLTPHPGEFRRLAAAIAPPATGGARAMDADTSEPLRRRAAEGLALATGCVVVLKGAGTVVSDGSRSWVNATGNAALATGGTGDVLAGVMASLLAQFGARRADPDTRPAAGSGGTRKKGGGISVYDAARHAVHVHGVAADRWVTRSGARAGLLAMELADEIPAAIEALAAERRRTARGRGGRA